MTAGQPFPADAVVEPGVCAGVYCQGEPVVAPVVACRVGETWRTALAVYLCADCLADFAVAGSYIPPDVKVITVDFPDGQAVATEIPHLRVWAHARDGLFHEVKGTLPNG